MISTARAFSLLLRPVAGLLALSLFATLLPHRVEAQTPVPRSAHGFGSHSKQESLLDRVTFKTPQGEIRLALPADLRAGEQVVGTISLFPKGKEEAQRTENRRVLGSYLLAIGTQTVATSETIGHWTLPLKTDFALTLQQKQALGAETASTGLVITPAGVPPSVEKTKARSSLPEKGQAGRPLALSALENVDLLSRHVLIGGKEAGFLAASPRLYIVESPADVFGKTTLQVRQGDTLMAEGRFRNDRVRRNNNVWVYVIVGVVIIGVVLVISINNSLNNIKNDLNHIPPINLQ